MPITWEAGTVGQMACRKTRSSLKLIRYLQLDEGAVSCLPGNPPVRDEDGGQRDGYLTSRW